MYVRGPSTLAMSRSGQSRIRRLQGNETELGAGIPVRDLLDLPSLAGSLVIAGHGGLDRVVRHVTVLEVPPPIHWLRGGELVLTTFFCVRDDSVGQEQVLRAMEEAGAAAIGFHRGNFNAQIPSHVVALANELNIPILHLPDQLNYIDVIEPIMVEIMSRQAPEPEIVQRVRTMLTRKVLSDINLQHLVELFIKEIPCTVFIIDRNGQIAARGSHLATEDEVWAVTDAMAEIQLTMEELTAALRDHQLADTAETVVEVPPTYVIEGDLHDIYCIPIITQNEVNGVVAFVQRNRVPLTSLRRSLFHELAWATALVMVREREKAATQRRLEGELLTLLTQVQPATEFLLLDQAARLGWNLRGRAYAIVFEVCHTGRQVAVSKETAAQSAMMLRELRWALVAADPTAVVIEANDYLLCFPTVSYDMGVKEAKAQIRRLFETARRAVCLRFPGIEVVASVGSRARSATDLRVSYERAMFGRMIRKHFPTIPCIIFSDELILYDALYRLADLPEVRRLYEMIVAPLAAYDEEHGSDLLATLFTFVEKNGHLQRTADALGIHVNTVRKRLARIADVTDIDFQSSDHMFIIHLCMKLHKLISLSNCVRDDSQ